MDEAAFIENIMLFGLGRQEALIYVCLIKNGALTGYEVSKLTGISRSNVYNTLAALVEHGAAYLTEGSSSKYLSVALAEFCGNRIRHLESIKDLLIHNSPKKLQNYEGYITIEGHQHIMDKIHHMLFNAGYRIYFSASAVFLEKWSDEINKAAEQGIKIVLISDRIPDNISNEMINFYQSIGQNDGWEERDKQLRLIIDSEYVLTGEINGSSSDNCLYCAQKNFVNVFKEAMSNEIKLIELAKDKKGND